MKRKILPNARWLRLPGLLTQLLFFLLLASGCQHRVISREFGIRQVRIYPVAVADMPAAPPGGLPVNQQAIDLGRDLDRAVSATISGEEMRWFFEALSKGPLLGEKERNLFIGSSYLAEVYYADQPSPRVIRLNALAPACDMIGDEGIYLIKEPSAAQLARYERLMEGIERELKSRLKGEEKWTRVLASATALRIHEITPEEAHKGGLVESRSTVIDLELARAHLTDVEYELPQHLLPPTAVWVGVMELEDGGQKQLALSLDGTFFQVIGERGSYFLPEDDVSGWRQILFDAVKRILEAQTPSVTSPANGSTVP